MLCRGRRNSQETCRSFCAGGVIQPFTTFLPCQRSLDPSIHPRTDPTDSLLRLSLPTSWRLALLLPSQRSSPQLSLPVPGLLPLPLLSFFLFRLLPCCLGLPPLLHQFQPRQVRPRLIRLALRVQL